MTFKKYLSLHIGFYDAPQNSPGALLTKLSSDTTKINGIALQIVGITVQTIVTVGVGILIGFIYDWRIGLINLAFFPFTAFTAVLEWKMEQGLGEEDEYVEIQAGSILSESVSNTKAIFSYNMENRVVGMYTKMLIIKHRSVKRKSLMNGVLYGFSQFILYVTHSAVFYAGAAFIHDNTLDLGRLIKVLFPIAFAAFGVGQAQQYIGDMAKAKESLVNIYKTLDEPSLIDPLDKNKNGVQADDVIGAIEFKDVSFAYPTRPSQLIFEKLNFTIKPGQNAAFVGFSGCGKSSIIQLLERFYDVIAGEVLIDGVNIKEYDLVSLRKRISLVMQEPVLFKTSIIDNIKYGKMDAGQDEVEDVAKKARISKFLSKDYDNNIIPVSGGEKQRIAIARAMLRDPRILLLDEATSALDKVSEEEVQKSLDEMMEGRTSITIAHR